MIVLLLLAGHPWGLSEGLEPLDLDAEAADWIDPATCGECHHRVYEDWQQSRHSVAWENPLMQAGYLVEQRQVCVNCHAPLRQQTAEIARNRDWYAARRPWGEPVLPEPKPDPEVLAGHGITCVTCHWREGEILGTSEVAWASHEVTVTPELSSPELCRSCHEFRAPEIHDGRVVLGDQPMQSTWSEWRAWAETGGTETCQSCHMPGGRHTFSRGAHDRQALAESIEVVEGEQAITLQSRGVGHHLPTGDIHRRLTLQVRTHDGWQRIATFGRSFEVRQSPNGHLSKHLVADTSLRPGQPVTVPLPRGTTAWRLVYHYSSADDEVRGLVSPEQLTHILAQGPSSGQTALP